MSIAQNISQVRQQLPGGTQMVAVSKYHTTEQIMEAYQAGQRVFGENHAQAIVAKSQQLPDDIKWHMIGHLQTNKVRMLMPCVDMIQSVDSVKLLRVIDKEAARAQRTVDVLLQLHVAREQTKTGFAIDELLKALSAGELAGLPGVRVRGLMAMATNTDNTALVESEFQRVHDTFRRIKDEFYADSDCFDQVSMGMSDDWLLAVKHGATLVRIGSAIFGPRDPVA